MMSLVSLGTRPKSGGGMVGGIGGIGGGGTSTMGGFGMLVLVNVTTMDLVLPVTMFSLSDSRFYSYKQWHLISHT